MTPELVGLLSLVSLIALVMLRVPVAVAMGGVAVIGFAVLQGLNRALNKLADASFELADGYSLSVVPLFLLMGAVAARSGMSADLFRAANSLFSGIRGGLAMATVGACAGFGAVSGSSLATAATMSRIALPQMDDHGYDQRLSTGAIAAAGTLGILIPPSVILIIYSILAGASVEELFAAGLMPGILLAVLYIIVVILISRFRPDWSGTEASAPLSQRFRDLLRSWEIIILFGVSVGGIYIGWFSPTEAASVGAFLAIVIGFATSRLNIKGLVEALGETVSTSAMLFFIIIMANVYAYFLIQTRLPQLLVDWTGTSGFSPMMIMLLMILFFLVLGCFLDALGMILIAVPIFIPLVQAIGPELLIQTSNLLPAFLSLDLFAGSADSLGIPLRHQQDAAVIWYGIIIVVVVEMGLITPPVGMNLFVIRAQNPNIKISTLYVGILPFLLANLVLIAFLILFPGLALWLPLALF
jgi:C4-dicarboxylate transporter DctM subunit